MEAFNPIKMKTERLFNQIRTQENRGGNMTDNNTNEMKHVICIQDLSCFGKCSLTIALPILNAAGLHVSPLPTALLSTHTGGLGIPYIHDLHTDMNAIAGHWKKLNFPLTAIYSAYASNQKQITEIAELFKQYPNTLHLVDPVIGDHGKRYSALNDEVIAGMKMLCEQADIITPNITEAYILLDEVYRIPPYEESELFRITQALRTRYHADIILTGVSISDHELGCVCLSKENAPQMLMSEFLPYYFHGSGDLFTASFLGAYLKGQSFTQACRCAMEYTTMCMKYSFHSGQNERYGICFEPLLSDYIHLINQ